MEFKATSINYLPPCKDQKPARLFLRSKNHKFSPLSWFFLLRPRQILILLLLLAFPIYFALSLERTVSAPFLNIEFPPEHFVTSEPSLIIFGSTDLEGLLTINSEQVIIQEDGKFQEVIPLSEGINTLQIRASRDGKGTVVERTVIRN